jgi:hypothetical protein
VIAGAGKFHPTREHGSMARGKGTENRVTKNAALPGRHHLRSDGAAFTNRHDSAVTPCLIVGLQEIGHTRSLLSLAPANLPLFSRLLHLPIPRRMGSRRTTCSPSVSRRSCAAWKYSPG